MDPMTVFTFGYWGWGNSTQQLIRAVDKVEAARGFEPPLFVDIRISRSVRAVGFNGNAFEEVVGRDRYVWIDDLGNRAIQTGKGRIDVKNPDAVNDLMAKAEENRKRRVIFFCSCELPGSERHQDNCHRVTVASLLLDLATVRKEPLKVVEWPGELPKVIRPRLLATEVAKVRRGGMSIPLGSRLPSTDLMALPWGSLCQVGSGADMFPTIVGPARFGGGSWYLPLPYEDADVHADLTLSAHNAAWWRRRHGFEPRTASL